MAELSRQVAATLHDTATECIVRFGDPAREIVAEAEAWGAELIAMTDRPGRVWWRRFRRVGESRGQEGPHSCPLLSQPLSHPALLRAFARLVNAVGGLGGAPPLPQAEPQ